MQIRIAATMSTQIRYTQPAKRVYSAVHAAVATMPSAEESRLTSDYTPLRASLSE